MDCIVFICESSCLALHGEARQPPIFKLSRRAEKKLGLFSNGHSFDSLTHFEDTANLHETCPLVNTLFATFLLAIAAGASKGQRIQPLAGLMNMASQRP
jgi:hypothetical protein